jgi:Ca2+-binding RTX toxin-like protein
MGALINKKPQHIGADVATYQVFNASPLDFEARLIFPDTAQLGARSATTAIYMHADGNTTVLVGSGFTFDPQTSLPTAGTIKSITLYGADLQPWATIRDLDYSLPTLHDIWFHLNDSVGVADLVLLAGNDIHIGSDHRESFGDWYDGNDTFYTGGGGDYISPGAGNDTVDGGDGIDKVAYSASANDPQVTNGATVDLEEGWAIDPWGYTDIIKNVERARGSMLADTLRGSSGDNMLEGRGGDDLLDGRNGFDIVSYERDVAQGGTGGVNVNLAGGIALDSFGNWDTLISIEAAIGTDQADTITGSAGDNLLNGLAGADRLSGGSGNDTLNGGLGNDNLDGGEGDDILEGQAGADTLTGGNGFDVVGYWSALAGVILDLADASKNTGDAEGDILSSIEHVSGTSHDDELYGDDSGNGFAGDNGNDLLSGRAGDDYLTGGAGNDTLDGGEGIDTYGTDGSQGEPFGIYVNLLSRTAYDGHGNVDTLISIENADGGALDDVLAGDLNANYLRGWEGNDTLDGNDGNDSLEGADGKDELYGGDGDDDLQGGSDEDLLEGGAGNDVLHNEAGVDTFMGGEDDDIFRNGWNEAEAGEIFDGSDGIDTITVLGDNDFRGTTILSIEQLAFENAANVTFGGIEAGATNWTIIGDGNVNSLTIRLDKSSEASLGSWTFVNWTSQDKVSVFGSSGRDVIEAAAVATTIDGGAGYDRLILDLSAFSAAQIIDMSNAGLQTAAHIRFQNMEAIAGSLGAGNDVVKGGQGDDAGASLDPWALDDDIDLGAGNDWFEGRGGNDSASGGTGNDTLDGGAGGDTLSGGAGHDTLYSRLGEGVIGYSIAYGYSPTEMLDGGAGIDFAIIDRSDATRSLSVDISDPSYVSFSNDGTILVNIERLEFSAGSGNDSLTGGSLNDKLLGAAGRDQLSGRAGNDTIDGGSGVDIIDGGEGDDSLLGGTGIDIIDGGSGRDTIYGGTEADLVDGGAGDDVIYGEAGADNIDGGDGNDLLNGGAGDDVVSGGAGNDTLVGGGGSDKLDGGAGTDTVILTGSHSDYSVVVTAEGLQVTHNQTKSTQFMTGLELFQMSSGATLSLAQFIQPASEPPVSQPPVTELPIVTVTVKVSTDFILPANVLHVVATGTSSVKLVGNTRDNSIVGNSGKNAIDGGDGNDKVNGGLGNDNLVGGSGKDAFMFTTKLGTSTTDRKVNFDTVKDFSVRDDSLYLDNAIFKKLGKKGTEQKPAKLDKKFFTVGDKAKDKDDYIVYDKKTGVLSYDADGSGKGEAVEFALLKNKPTLKVDDFFVI